MSATAKKICAVIGLLLMTPGLLMLVFLFSAAAKASGSGAVLWPLIFVLPYVAIAFLVGLGLMLTIALTRTYGSTEAAEHSNPLPPEAQRAAAFRRRHR